jgi:hypothetical protein
MSASVAAAGYTNYSGSSLSAAGLQAQIAIYQRQLSDCVNCSSADTIAGKSDIQQISSKISAAKSQIQQIQDQTPPKASAATTNANASVNAVANSPVTRALTIAPGNNVDLFA